MCASRPADPEDTPADRTKPVGSPPLSSTLRHVQNVQSDGDASLSWGNLCEKITRWVAEATHGQGLPTDRNQDDLTQDVLLQVCRDIGEFRVEPGASFSGWVRMIAHRKVADAWRRAKSKKRGGGRVRHLGDFDEQGGREHFADPAAPRPSMLARHGELQQALDAALGKLDAKYRQVIELHWFQGLSFAEIAPKIGYQKEVTVRSLHLRARERLQELLTSFGG